MWSNFKKVNILVGASFKMDENLLYEAAYKGDFDFVKSKVDENSQLVLKQDENNRILLHWSALSGNVKLVEYLFEKQSSVDPVDDTESTPLILAASAGRVEVVKYLIEKGAKVNHKTTQGHSALQYACSKGWIDIAAVLLGSGADINIADIRGATPLHRAASKGNLAIVKLLIAFKDTSNLKVDIRDGYGNTALHLACEEDRQEEAILLVENGADLDSQNLNHKTPLDLCNFSLCKILSSKRSK